MNREQIEGNWQIFRGRIKEEWGKFTDDELDELEGKVDQIAGQISVKYGLAKEEAYKKLKALESAAASRTD